MSECICNSCKNLKSIINENDSDENGIAEEYECEYGLPSERCSDCEEEACELTCEHYINEGEEDEFIISKCISCGKELKTASGNNEDGEVYCVTCYLNK